LNSPQHEALGNNYRVCGVYFPEPRAKVYCLRLNFNVRNWSIEYDWTLRDGVNSLIRSIACTKQSNLFIHFLRTEKYLYRSFGTIQCLLMKCVQWKKTAQCVQRHIDASAWESAAYTTCIAQVALEFISYTLLVDNRRFNLIHLQLSLDLITNKNSGGLQVFQLFTDS